MIRAIIPNNTTTHIIIIISFWNERKKIAIKYNTRKTKINVMNDEWTCNIKTIMATL